MNAASRRGPWPWGLLLLALCCLCGPTPATADDDEAPLRTIAAAADDVQHAARAKDTEALRKAATTRDPDPWLVAHELCARDAFEAALGLARALEGTRAERLTQYIESRRGVPDDAPAREALRAARAAAANEEWQALLEAAGTPEAPFDTPARVALAYEVGRASARLHKEEATAWLAASAGGAQQLGWTSQAARGHYEGGLSAYRRADYATALPLFEAALRNYESLNDRRGRADVLWRIGNLFRRTGRYDDALERQRQAHALFTKLESVEGRADALRAIGMVHEERGTHAVALDHYEQALVLAETLDDPVHRLKALESVGIGRYNLGDYRRAKDVFQEVLAGWDRAGDPARIRRTLSNLGAAYQALGDSPRALKQLKRALKIGRELENPSSEATILINMGAAHAAMGEYTAALGCYGQALAIYEQIDEPYGQGILFGNFGSLYGYLGDHERAERFHNQALATWRRLKDPTGEAEALIELGVSYSERGALEEALEIQQRAMKLAQSADYLAGTAHSLLNMGEIQIARGDPKDALKRLEQAQQAFGRLEDRHGEAATLAIRGHAHVELGDRAQGVKLLEEAEKAAWALRATSLHVTTLGLLARGRLRMGDARGALRAAGLALRSLEDLLGGLAEEEGASARERHLDVLSAGTLAAARLDDPAEMLTFLESGRASLLLESLDGRGALQWDDLPEGLRIAEADAKAAVKRAQHEYGQARKTGKRAAKSAALKQLDTAQEGLLVVAARIQRDAKRQAEVFYPRAETLDGIQDLLKPGTALVMYALSLDEALALVLTKDSERIVALGKAAPITAACTSLEAGRSDVDCTAGLARLRKQLVDPLELDTSVKTVLISPEGALCYVPFGALIQDKVVAMTPSGTTHASLSEDQGRGTRVLALGDPEYGAKVDPGAKQLYQRGASLGPLPASKEEAEAVGDVTLIGPQATEAGLRAALKKERRWRAVHFACHGLVNAERPTLSSLALTRGGEDDGFFTGLEVLRTRIPADLVVLSACDTGRGKLVKGEGIVGLTRTFMYAGSARVICSLWKVNDAATKALMVKFYELWNPDQGKRLGAAAALQQAQAFVRDHPDHPQWKHPYYWAAWVLWGLPD